MLYSVLEVQIWSCLKQMVKRPWHDQVRFMRKPRWIPMAKSKMYKNVELKTLPQVEEEEIERIKEHYQIYHQSLWQFQSLIYEAQVAKSQSSAKEISEEGDLERILHENDLDNAKVRAIRERSLEKEWKEVEESILIKRSELEDIALEKVQAAELKMRSEMERIKTCIKEEDLDEVIEKALASHVDYNYAIDKDGKVYRGRHNSSIHD